MHIVLTVSLPFHCFSGSQIIFVELPPKKMAQILSNQYESVFSTPLPDITHHMNKCITESKLTDIIFTQDDFIQAIKEISSYSAAGPDGIPVKFYKDYVKEIAEPLFII